MKTVQEWLKDIDRQELVNTYQYLYPTEFWQLKDREITVAEVYRRQAKCLTEFIDELLTLTPSTDDRKMIFIAVSAYQDGHPEVETFLIAEDDLNNDRPPERYGWMMADREKLVGYKIADTEMTLDNISEVLAQILEEASFLGFSQDTFLAERESLNKSLEASMKDIEEGRYYTADEVWDHLGLKREPRDPRAEELRAEVTKAELKYNTYSWQKQYSMLMGKPAEEEIDESYPNQ